MNGAQLDSTPNSMSTGSTGTHPSLLQPISMQNILAMACLGQSPLSPTASSQSLSAAAQLGSASTPLCTYTNGHSQYKPFKQSNYTECHFLLHFRVNARLQCGRIATICQRIVCTDTDNSQHFKYDCITCCWQTNRRYANSTNYSIKMQNEL